MSDKIENLCAECDRIEEYCLWNASSHFEAAAMAGRVQAIGGAIPIICGGIGTWKFLTDPSLATPEKVFLASAMMLTAGIVGSLLAYWNLAKVRLEHFAAATKYKTLENEARRARHLHVHDDGYDAFKVRVLELARRYDDLGEASAQSFDFALWLARRKMRAGVFESEGAPAPATKSPPRPS